MIIIQNRSGGGDGYLVPAGGEVLWYGTASALPSEWQIDSYADNVFVRAANTGGASNTIQGASSHSHSVPSTSSVSDHTHACDTQNMSNTNDDEAIVPTSNGIYNAPYPHSHTGSSSTSSAAGGHSHNTSNTNSATIYPPYRKLYWIKALEETSIPIGGIVMWDDVIANIAEGFNICDGGGSTPDLRDKFIYGAASDSDVGDSGGSTSHVHSNPNTGTAGYHTHLIYQRFSGGGSTEQASGYTSGVEIASSGHNHNATATSNADSAHNHTIGNTGSSSHVPLYIQLYFIMRVV